MNRAGVRHVPGVWPNRAADFRGPPILELLLNLAVALRILLTVPVTVASGERSFSRLKLIKTFLRSTMSQDRLVGLAILSIENDVVQTLDFADLLSQFASQKARKI